jgi:hypothetical protein
MPPAAIKPTDKAIKAYYAALAEYSQERVTHEGALETAFQQLLADTARPHGWFLIPKQSLKLRGKHVVPDGTLRDEFNLHRGFWAHKRDRSDRSIIKMDLSFPSPLIQTLIQIHLSSLTAIGLD